MNISKEVQSFIEDNIELIELNTKESWELVYASLDSATLRGQFTTTMLLVGIDPAEILDHIPNCYLCKSEITNYKIPDDVTNIGDYAFEYCSSLTSVAISDSVTRIGHAAFKSCDSLTRIEIPDSVTSMGERSFYDCTSLTSVVIPASVTSIGYGAFYNCSSLTSVVICDGVTSIGNNAFYGCDSLTSVVIGDSVTSIGDGAFCWCNYLKEIQFNCTKKDAITRLKVMNESWRKLSSIQKIICTDGVIDL